MTQTFNYPTRLGAASGSHGAGRGRASGVNSTHHRSGGRVPEFEYDLAIVGSGPAGHRAAIQGAKLRKRVIVIERNPIIGGVCVNTGTIPSKTLREAVLYLSGYREHSMYGASYRVKERITLA